MPTVDLTPCLVRESKAQGRDTFLFDRSLPGFGRCIHSSGRKVWMVQARIKGWSRRLHLYGGGLTPKLPELIKRTFRGVHLLVYLKHEELMQIGRSEGFESAAEDARTVQHETLGPDDESAPRVEHWMPPSGRFRPPCRSRTGHSGTIPHHILPTPDGPA